MSSGEDHLLILTAETMLLFMEAELRKSKCPEDFVRQKWMRLVAINEVGLEQPLYYTRFGPEISALSWFFGFPVFNRNEDARRTDRIPKNSTQAKKDPCYAELVKEIRNGVLEALKGKL